MEEKNKNKSLNNPKKSNSHKKRLSPKKIYKKEELNQNDSNNYNFFNFDENNNINKNEQEKVIDANILLQKLKEEEEDTKIMLYKLNGRKKKNRDFVKEMEQEKKIRERYNTKKNLMEKKKADEYNRMVQVIKSPINIKRTNKIEKKLNNNLEKHKNDKMNNIDFKKQLNLQLSSYEDNIRNVDNGKFKKEAENKKINIYNYKTRIK